MAADKEFIDPADVEAIKKQVTWAAGRDVSDFLRDTARHSNRTMPRGRLDLDADGCEGTRLTAAHYPRWPWIVRVEIMKRRSSGILRNEIHNHQSFRRG